MTKYKEANKAGNVSISVALAVYNGERYIRKQLQSICTQTIVPDEIIISDDGSTDGTVDIIKDFFDSYSHMYYTLILGRTGGVVKNFRRALSNVTGDIIILCDQDDIWLENKIEVIRSTFLNNSEIKALNSSFEYIDEEDNVIININDKDKSNHNLILHYIPEGYLEKIPIELVIHKNISPGMTMAVNKEIVRLYLGLPGEGNLHDFELNCIAAIEDGLYFLNKTLVLYRIHKNQTVSIGNLKKKSFLEMLEKKLSTTSEQIASMQSILDELSQIVYTKSCKEYLCKVKKFIDFRKKVVDEGKIYLWPTELIYFMKCQKSNTLDVRYCYIDLLAGIKYFISRERK